MFWQVVIYGRTKQAEIFRCVSNPYFQAHTRGQGEYPEYPGKNRYNGANARYSFGMPTGDGLKGNDYTFEPNLTWSRFPSSVNARNCLYTDKYPAASNTILLADSASQNKSSRPNNCLSDGKEAIGAGHASSVDLIHSGKTTALLSDLHAETFDENTIKNVYWKKNNLGNEKGNEGIFITKIKDNDGYKTINQ